MKPAKSLTSDPRISIAMATYNGEKHIREQLDSLVRQTVLPFELVVTDDGSTDGTLEILKEFSGRAPFPVRIFRNTTRLGYEENFLKAASLCNGDAIAFCDQDDIWIDRKIEVCSRIFTDRSITAVIHTGQLMRDSGELLQEFHPTTRKPECGTLEISTCKRQGRVSRSAYGEIWWIWRIVVIANYS